MEVAREVAPEIASVVALSVVPVVALAVVSVQEKLILLKVKVLSIERILYGNRRN